MSHLRKGSTNQFYHTWGHPRASGDVLNTWDGLLVWVVVFPRWQRSCFPTLLQIVAQSPLQALVSFSVSTWTSRDCFQWYRTSALDPQQPFYHFRNACSLFCCPPCTSWPRTWSYETFNEALKCHSLCVQREKYRNLHSFVLPGRLFWSIQQ